MGLNWSQRTLRTSDEPPKTLYFQPTFAATRLQIRATCELKTSRKPNKQGWHATCKQWGMKPKIICRFCGQLVAKRMTDHRADGYKPVLYSHKCPHGCDCFGGQQRGKGQNWAVLVLGNKDVAGCRKCYEAQLTRNAANK